MPRKLGSSGPSSSKKTSVKKKAKIKTAKNKILAKEAERVRRTKIRLAFAELKAAIPNSAKFGNIRTLRAARDYISNLRARRSQIILDSRRTDEKNAALEREIQEIEALIERKRIEESEEECEPQELNACSEHPTN